MGRVAGAVLVAGLLAAAGARAQGLSLSIPPSESGWTATAGRTVGANNNVLLGEAGWPSLSATYLRGMDARTDVGGRLAFVYGFEGTTNSVSGVNIQGVLRRSLGATESGIDLLAHAEPGIALYGNNGTLFGITAPVGLVAGMRIDPKLTVDATADVPILLSLSNPSGIAFGPQVGAGAEYQIDPTLAVSVRARLGPEFLLASGGSETSLAFQTLLGLAWKAR